MFEKRGMRLSQLFKDKFRTKNLKWMQSWNKNKSDSKHLRAFKSVDKAAKSIITECFTDKNYNSQGEWRFYVKYVKLRKNFLSEEKVQWKTITRNLNSIKKETRQSGFSVSFKPPAHAD